MQIIINTDSNIESNEELAQQVKAMVVSALERFGDRITRVEVHLSDENSHKFGTDDKRCLLEARLAGLQPIAASYQAATLQQAINGAAEKLKNATDSALGRRERNR
jgi:ribosome-associated translation inhibitor RaiA